MNFQEFNFRTEYKHNIETYTYRNLAGKNCDINVLTYLPVSDKNDLIAISLQKAEQDGIYNELLLDVYFHLNIIYLYTDIEFTDEDREDELELYDILETNGIIDEVVKILGDEYKDLRDLLDDMKFNHLNYDNTAAAVLRRIITDLPKNAATAKEIVDSFDQGKYQQVVDFATAANGGRNINTNAAPVNQETAPIKPFAAPQDHLKKQPQRKILKVESVSKKD